jgi:hypothetical protein
LISLGNHGGVLSHGGSPSHHRFIHDLDDLG